MTTIRLTHHWIAARTCHLCGNDHARADALCERCAKVRQRQSAGITRHHAKRWRDQYRAEVAARQSGPAVQTMRGETGR